MDPHHCAADPDQTFFSTVPDPDQDPNLADLKKIYFHKVLKIERENEKEKKIGFTVNKKWDPDQITSDPPHTDFIH